MENLENKVFNVTIAQDAVNRLEPTDDALKKGILVKQDINSPQPNGYFYKITQAIQYLQFTGGMYNKEAEYNEGNICHLLIKINKGTSPKYELIQFRRNSSNPLLITNNPPIKEAIVETINGIDSYEGGTPNGDWDRMTIAYSIDGIPNTLALRRDDGSIQATTPEALADNTLINKSYFDTNKVNNPTKASLVTLDSITGLTASNVQQGFQVLVNDKIPDIYDYSGTETLTNKIAIVNGVRKQVYRKCKEADYQFIQNGAYHRLDIFEIPNPSLITSLKGRVRKKPNEFTYSLNYSESDYGLIQMVTYGNAQLSIEYILNTGQPNFVNHYVVEIEYVK